MSPYLQDREDGVLVAVYVQPKASRNELTGLQGDELKVRLTSPPVEGAANSLCCTFLAQRLGVAKSRVSLIAGHKSRHKKLFVQAVASPQVRSLLKL